jgi:acylphosphatase
MEGRVQGVFYRAFTRDQAVNLGLNGWVRNMPDGRVEAVFEGREELIEQVIIACKKGPPGAHVANVNVIREPVAGDRGFEIRY